MKFTSIFFTASETWSTDNDYQAAEAENPCNTNKKKRYKVGIKNYRHLPNGKWR